MDNNRWKTPAVIAAIVLAFAGIAYMRYKSVNRPRDHTEETQHVGPQTGQQESLNVAFLPVTCHLTCPVTDYASNTSTTGTRFDALRFTEFPPIIEALKTKKLLAGFITVPLAMKMREQGAPVRIACLGHRDGSQLVIRKENPAKTLQDMRGKTIAIPSPFSNENFFLTKMLRDQGLKPGEIKTVVLPPPDMNAALAAKSIDGFIVAEPFCAKAEIDGEGRVLYYAKDIWPNYISCCLVVHEDLIKEKPEVVKDLVRGIIASGEWTEQHRKEAGKLVAPYFRQKEKLLTYILTQKPDRVTYRNLNPTDEELQKIMDMGMDLGFLKKKTPLRELIDRDYIPANVTAPNLDLSRIAEITSKKG
ncbi:MAG: ABC transporter substrate-binding protein [Armatimonas sp.]